MKLMVFFSSASLSEYLFIELVRFYNKRAPTCTFSFTYCDMQNLKVSFLRKSSIILIVLSWRQMILHITILKEDVTAVSSSRYNQLMSEYINWGQGQCIDKN